MRRKIMCLWAVLILCTGCTHPQPLITESVPLPSEIVAVTEEHTTPVTEFFSEPTEAVCLDISAGSYLRRFDCEDTGDYLDYYLFVPEHAEAQMPLMIFLHGDGEVCKVNLLESYGPIRRVRELYGEEYPFIMISPCTRDYSWTKGTIPDTLMSLIRAIMDELYIDFERVIITGHSRGAIGVWYLVSEYGDFFSAAVPISCGSDDDLNFDNLEKVTIFALAGDVGQSENNYRRAMEKMVSQLKERNGTAEFILLEGSGHGDTVETAFTIDLINWILEK